MEPVSPALAGGFFTPEPPGTPQRRSRTGKPSSVKDAQAPSRIWNPDPSLHGEPSRGCPSVSSGLMQDICAPVSSQ